MNNGLVENIAALMAEYCFAKRVPGLLNWQTHVTGDARIGSPPGPWIGRTARPNGNDTASGMILSRRQMRLSGAAAATRTVRNGDSHRMTRAICNNPRAARRPS
jgi:hypothetical protein